MVVITVRLPDVPAALVRDYALHLGVSEEEFVKMCLYAELGVEYEETRVGDLDGLGEGD